MGIGLRIFLVNDNDFVHRLPLTKFERLRRRYTEECLPQYAGKRVRYALVVTEMERRNPVAIHRIQYAFLHFDSEGRLDIKEQEREARLAVELFPSIPDEEHPPQVIDAQHRFARKRYTDEYKWTPSLEMEAAIVEAVFGKDKC